MRLRPEKIDDLARELLSFLQKNSRVELLASADAVRNAVGGAIRDNLEEEDDILHEADELLRAHVRQIDEEGLDVELLRSKFKQEIARQRGFVL